MGAYIFCIMIPLIHNNPGGAFHNYNDKYECFKTEEKCNKKLYEYKLFLKRFQDDSMIKKEPYCDRELLKKMSIENNINEKEEPVKKSCWLFC